MRHLPICLGLLVIFSSCKKDNTSSDTVEIYLLKSHTITTDIFTFPVINNIENPVLESTPLVANKDLELYIQKETTFKIRKDINSIVRSFGKDKGFAVVVNGEPVYYGRFYPAFLSSVEFGVATIMPDVTHKSVFVHFPGFPGSTLITDLDKRNDERLLRALRASGRLR